ncbi:MAG: hypothetical protein E6K43_11935, partial [Gammaproteobacteria bacterium]
MATRTRCALLALVIGAASAVALDRVAPVAPGGAPQGLAAQPVEESYFGTTVIDRFRFVEAKDAATLGWMKSQGAYTRAVFDSIAPRAAYLDKLGKLGAAFGLVNSVQAGGARTFYLERKPGADVFDLMVREADGKARTLIDTAALIRAAGGVPQAIDYYQVEHDGTHLAVGISPGGSEASRLSVLDVASGRTIAGPIDRAQWGSPSWLTDGSGLFFLRLQDPQAVKQPSEKYLNPAAYFWDLHAAPAPIAGAATGLGPVTDPVRFPFVVVVPNAGRVVLVEQNGVQNEFASWTAPLTEARSGRASWRPLTVTADDVTSLDGNATTLFLLSHKDAPTFKVLSLPVDGTLATARTLIQARPERVIESIHAAADGLYVAGREGLTGVLLHVDAHGTLSTLSLPFAGIVEEVATDPTHPGAIVALVGWVHPRTHYRYDPASGKFTDLHLDSIPTFDASRYQAAELTAQAGDGTRVPLSVITPRGAVQARPLLLDAYGAYGISNLPSFQPRIVALVDAGGSYAECHVRGGGELGETWRLGGKDADKPNTWRDFIACAEMLIKNGYTTREMLTIQGTSAGGITVGRAATERPELFAGAIGRVGDLDALRSEVMPSGPANIPEFGTVKNEQGFKNLMAMDAYQHVRNDTRYPA